VLSKIRQLGDEYGSTTGRPRQINWLDLDLLIKAININGVTDLIINKLDILMDLGIFKLIHHSEILFNDEEHFKKYIKNIIKTNCPTIQKINFSVTPYKI
jgi:adenylosuccinate synthase